MLPPNPPTDPNETWPRPSTPRRATRRWPGDPSLSPSHSLPPSALTDPASNRTDANAELAELKRFLDRIITATQNALSSAVTTLLSFLGIHLPAPNAPLTTTQRRHANLRRSVTITFDDPPPHPRQSARNRRRRLPSTDHDVSPTQTATPRRPRSVTFGDESPSSPSHSSASASTESATHRHSPARSEPDTGHRRGHVGTPPPFQLPAGLYTPQGENEEEREPGSLISSPLSGSAHMAPADATEALLLDDGAHAPEREEPAPQPRSGQRQRQQLKGILRPSSRSRPSRGPAKPFRGPRFTD